MAEEKKPVEKPEEQAAPPHVETFGHKNPPVGPATGKPIADWRKTRDYEQFMPSANM